MKIAIASSGLGHIVRGIETWAKDTAIALARRGVDVTLFAGAHLSDPGTCEPGNPRNQQPTTIVIPCLRRGDAAAKRLSRMAPGFAWRWALTSEYGWEQVSFWWHLWPILREEGFDILHVQDPMLAYWCRKFRALGLVGTREILAHGTEESPEFLARFAFVQHLVPWHMEQTMLALNVKKGSAGVVRDEKGENVQHSTLNAQRSSGESNALDIAPSTLYSSWRVIPNFVDTECFCPRADKRREIRTKLGVPENAFVIGTVAAVKKHHKRIDYLIREFAAFASQRSEVRTQKSEDGKRTQISTEDRSEARHPASDSTPTPRYSDTPILLIAGARTDESDELIQLANELVPGRVKTLLDLPHNEMPDVYGAMDVFVIASLFEMMSIAIAEAMASGLPVLFHSHPVLEWVVGKDYKSETGNLSVRCGSVCGGKPEDASGNVSETGTLGEVSGGACVDMSKDGNLALALQNITPAWIEEKGRLARERALKMFSGGVVIEQIVQLRVEVLRGRIPRF